MQELVVPLETVCFIIIIMKERQSDLKEAATKPDPGSNPIDDNDGMQEELMALISDLSDDEQIDLVALMWLGRNHETDDDGAVMRAQAADAHNERTAEYLCGEPLLADHLAAGLDTIGLSCADFESEHL